MEDIPELYSREYDVGTPVICTDGQPRHLIAETGEVIPPEPGRADYEYERNGTAEIFMFTGPLSGWRHVSVRECRTGIDWAYEVRDLSEIRYPEAERIRLVCDNLNTHKIASFYKIFPPDEARRLINRPEIHHTPKHGSWLNIAEIGLSALTIQCPDRRIPDIETLHNETKAWEHKRNELRKGVIWQFRTENARIKLKRLYPQIQT
jgi:hypothetical protein